MKFIIEHLDEEFFEWSLLEYKSLTEYVAPQEVLFTRFEGEPPSSLKALTNANFTSSSIEQLPLDDTSRVCLLDSEASETLDPSDEKLFDYYLFGGILGNSMQLF